MFTSEEGRILAYPILHSIPAFGYRIEEADAPGNLDVDKVRALGVVDFEDFRRLKEGESVQLDDGRMLNPEDVVTPVKQGATFAYITDTRACKGSLELAQNAQLVYHEATFLQDDLERAERTAHTTAAEAARVAKDAGAEKLIIGHFSARYDDTRVIVEEARSIFKNTEAAEELKRYTL